ncbi:GIY-YIG nuclease family protein [Thiothrix lacustris]|uniref:GIY-YIG nuclease family protein n=1 Tax=Thiothrix lacustris TaxID=525917 RepID=UPI0027E53B61|nr:GIY-YIG nuclease family protein [Thiothrix lacustris]WMP17544.1 GIY-YIG nuclease family protein [Thiothrix lacustris]
MIDFDKELQAILADDPLGLLEVKPQTSHVVTADERLVAAFEEINTFVETHGHEPSASRDIQERKLYSRLQGLREDTEKMAALLPLDRFLLLLGGDLGEKDDDNIFKLKHVTAAERASAELIAKRKPCKHFAAHEADFAQVQQELKAGTRQLLRFNDKGEQLVAGAYYVLGGVLLKLAAINFTSEEKTVAGKRFRKDGRTYCIFENGTESNMLYRSLAKALYQDGKIVSDSNTQIQQDFAKRFGGVTEEDTVTGYVYVLRSLSQDPAIRGLPHLYKIGFSSQPTQQRIKNAAQELTYLMADVEVVAEYQTYNLNPQKMEWLLHTFFAESCLNLDVFDSKGKRHMPREWFIVPFPLIETTIGLLLNEQIRDYRYDAVNQRIVGLKPDPLT